MWVHGYFLYFTQFLCPDQQKKINILMDTVFASKYLSVLRVSSLYFFLHCHTSKTTMYFHTLCCVLHHITTSRRHTYLGS